MSDTPSGSFTTNKRSLNDDTTLEWGKETTSDTNQSWGDAITTTNSITITDTGAVKQQDPLLNNGDFFDWDNMDPQPPHSYTLPSGTLESNIVSTTYSDRNALEHVQDGSMDDQNRALKAASRTIDLSNASTLNCATWFNADGEFDHFEIQIDT